MNILIADDTAENLYLLEKYFQGKGHTTVSAVNGAEALTEALKEPPDIIVSDILMPVMDGFTLCSEWRRSKILQKIPFIFYTATYTDPKDEELALKLGADRFIIKPTELKTLLHIIKETYDTSRLETAAPLPPAPALEGEGFLNEHNKALVRKLEDKMTQLEATETELRAKNVALEKNIEGLKRTEAALTASEMRYRMQFEGASDGIALADYKTGELVDCNLSLCRMVERDKAELVGQPQSILHPPAAAAEKLAQTFQQHRTTAPGSALEDTLISKSGKLIPAEIRASRVEINGHDCLMGVFRDITERKREEAERNKILLWQQGINLLQQSLLATATLEEKFSSITDSIVRLFGADFCRIWLIQPGDLCEEGCVHAGVKEGPHICQYRDRCLHLMASSGRYTHKDGVVHSRVPFGCYKIGRVASDQDHKFLTNNVQNDPRVHDHEWARELGLVSFVGYQLRVPGGETLGVLALFSKHPIQAGEDAILDGLSSTAALVIQRDCSQKSLIKTLDRLRKAVGATIRVMVSVVESRDPYTAGHQLRVADLAGAIAAEMALPREKIDGIRMAGSIHDLGKLSIPAEILSKPTKLTDTEFSMIKEHPQKGYEILKDVESSWPLAEMVYQHHERMNGFGYPRNLKGDDILMEARILAVADVVEAMGSHRPYRPSLGIDVALEEIEKNKGTLYDSAVADACLRLFREKGYHLPQA